ncbi:hypothetical protein [Thermosulfidibacter takaii]|nr:hypothetical protein [Thermosulfidibacter takaii]
MKKGVLGILTVATMLLAGMAWSGPQHSNMRGSGRGYMGGMHRGRMMGNQGMMCPMMVPEKASMCSPQELRYRARMMRQMADRMERMADKMESGQMTPEEWQKFRNEMQNMEQKMEWDRWEKRWHR